MNDRTNTLTDRVIAKLKDNLLVAILLIIVIITTGFATFSKSINEIYELIIKPITTKETTTKETTTGKTIDPRPKVQQFKLDTHCTTKGTHLDGVRESCSSNPDCHDSPYGYVIDRNSIPSEESAKNNCNGECYCKIHFQGDSKICLTASGYSPGGMSNAGAGGTAHCSINGMDVLRQ